MYALPKSSEAYVNLQAKINQEKGSAEYIAPLSGENRQTIQLVDVDGDGVQEAVAFFRDTTSENPLKIVIFKQDEHEEYQAVSYTHLVHNLELPLGKFLPQLLRRHTGGLIGGTEAGGGAEKEQVQAGTEQGL